MDRRPLGESGLSVSELTLGAMTFGRENDTGESLAIVAAYAGLGGTMLDTADAYNDGRSEEICGRALREHGGSLAIATKTGLRLGLDDPGGYRPERIYRCVDASLRRLGTDHVDLYQLHIWDPTTPLEDAVGALSELVAAGKIRAFGLSNLPAWAVALGHGAAAGRRGPAFATAQYHYSLACRDIELDVVPLCLELGIGVLPWSPLSGGFLTAKYRSGRGGSGRREGPPEWRGYALQRVPDAANALLDRLVDIASRLDVTPGAVALNWLLGRPGVTSAVIGCRTVEQLAANAAACGWPLPPGDRRALDELSRPGARYPNDFLELVLGPS